MMSSWKIATINVQGINNQEKFNDVIHWIDSNNIDITILTETKLSPTTAFFYFTNQKKYTTHWTQDPDRPKGSGVGIILNRDKIGKHEYRFQHHRHTRKQRPLQHEPKPRQRRFHLEKQRWHHAHAGLHIRQQ